MSYFQTDFAKWDKGGNNPVTEADIAIDRMLRDRLTGAFPEYGWLSEETTDEPSRLNKQRVWIVDPIDGTRAFIRGKPHFTICIALVEDGRPISAVVFNPAENELFEAVEGGGALLNGAAIRPTDRTELAGARMLGSAEFYRSKRWPTPWPEMHVESRNSIAYRVALVAAGMFDGCVSMSNVNDWDLAAADLILSEAGGRLSQREGAYFEYNRNSASHPNLVAAGARLHDVLLAHIAPTESP